MMNIPTIGIKFIFIIKIKKKRNFKIFFKIFNFLFVIKYSSINFKNSITKKTMIEPEIILEFIKNRRSIHSFQKTQIPKNEIETILEATRWTPKCL
ncbi:MAG: nitroreductase family protein [Promethearchaeota archaeon]